MSLFASVCCLEAAIPVTPFGSNLQEFNTRPNVTEWVTWRVPGGSADIITPGELDSLVQMQSVTSFTEPLWVDFSVTPFYHIESGWSGSRQAVYTGPGGTAANLLLATLSNGFPTALTFLRLGYKQDVVQPSGPILETVPGQRVLYSFTGTPNSWVYIPQLSDQPNPGYREVWLTMPSWPPGAVLYLLWADDNSGLDDGCYTIDDFAADRTVCDSFPWLQPFADLNVIEGGIERFRIGICPSEQYDFQWYKDDVLLSGATNATLTFPAVRLGDAGIYFATLAGPSGVYQSRRATLTVAPDVVPPAALVAYRMVDTNQATDRIGVFFSERVDSNSVVQVTNYSLRKLDGTLAASILGVSTVTESNVVLLTEPLPDGSYVLQVSNILDQAATANVISPNPTVLPVQTFDGLTVVRADHAWKYFEATNLTVPPGWQSRGFDDAPWRVGAGALGAPFTEPLPPPFQMNTALTPPSVNGAITTYFRTLFQLAPDQTNRVLQLSGVFDDGAVVYLNGVEVWRERLPAGTLSATAFATNAPENPGPLASGPIDVFVPGLLKITNVLAVELHQVTITSGDAVMGLMAQLSEPPCTPRLGVARNGDLITVTWTCGGTLQARTDLFSGAWHDIVTSSNQLSTNMTAEAMFFRVRP